MTHDEHQRERMRVWTEAFSIFNKEIPAIPDAAEYADSALAEFDERFPAPAAVEVAPEMHDTKESEMWAELREKARLWDAVASGKITLCIYSDGADVLFNCGYDRGSRCTDNFSNAAEAVQAAIDAGALK